MPVMPPTYATQAEADDYFAFRLNSAAWDGASDDDKGKALVTATRAIDRLNFAGVRTSDFVRLRPVGFVIPVPRTLDPVTDGQPLEFPRNGSSVIPQPIKDAACEVALALLDGVDPELEMQSLGTHSQRFAAASVTFDVSQARMAFRHGIASQQAWILIQPYLADPLEISLKRVD